MFKDYFYFFAKQSNIGLISKIYIWSIVLEPLLFFVVQVPFLEKGTGQNISRFLQLFVLIALGMKILVKQNAYNIPNPFYTPYKFYFYYIILSFFSGIYGYLIGAYNIPQVYFSNSLVVTLYRPLIEYIIVFYYFFYFVILFRYFVKTSEEINYFFKVFTWLFFLSLIIGYIDLFLLKIFGDNIYYGVPRHIKDITHYFSGRSAVFAAYESVGMFSFDTANLKFFYPKVGFRFHGLAGEPRHAFAYIVFGMGMFALKDIWINQKKFTYFLLIILIITLFLSETFSGSISLIFSSFLVLIYFFPKLNFKRKLLTLILILSFIFSAILFVKLSYRLTYYLYEINFLYETLHSGEKLSPTLRLISNNIFPFWHRWTEILQLNILPIFIGTGLGSSSIINNIYLLTNEVRNPNAAIVRTIYESGLIGLLIFISAFTYPIKSFIAPKKIILKIYFWMLVILGTYFAIRTSTPFIYLGIFIVVFENKFSHQSKTKSV